MVDRYCDECETVLIGWDTDRGFRSRGLSFTWRRGTFRRVCGRCFFEMVAGFFRINGGSK